MGVDWKDVLATLEEAREVIHIFHGDIAWDMYQHSPEMKRLNGMIDNVKSMIPYNAGTEEIG